MGNASVWLAGLGVLLGIALIAGAIALARILEHRRREVLHAAFANRCPSCRRLGALQVAGRERIPGTLRRVSAKGEDKLAWVARYQVRYRCLFCGAVKVEEEEGPAEPPVSGTMGKSTGE